MAAAILPWAIPAAISVAGRGLDYLTRKKHDPKVTQIPALSGGQQKLLDQSTGGIEGPLSEYYKYMQGMMSGSPESYQNFEAPYMRQFQEKVIPGLENAATSFGMRGSSGMQQSLAQAGTGLQERLAMMREGLRSQAATQLQQMMSGIMNVKPYNTVYEQGYEEPGWGSVGRGVTDIAEQQGGYNYQQWANRPKVGQQNQHSYNRPMQPGEMYSPSYGYGYAG